MGEIYAVQLDNEEDVYSGPSEVDEKRFSQVAADFETGYKHAGTATKKRLITRREGGTEVCSTSKT